MSEKNRENLDLNEGVSDLDEAKAEKKNMVKVTVGWNDYKEHIVRIFQGDETYEKDIDEKLNGAELDKAVAEIVQETCGTDKWEWTR